MGEVWFNGTQIMSGSTLVLSMEILNKGGQPVEITYPYFGVKTVQLGSDRDAADRQIHADFLKAALKSHSQDLNDGKQGITVGAGAGVWNTMTIPPYRIFKLTGSYAEL